MSAPSSRVAFISDVHGNIDALDAVLNDLQTQGLDEVVCLGDMVGYGAAPVDCVQTVRQFCRNVVLGNHEAMAVYDDGVLLGELPPRIKRPIELARRDLPPHDKDWLMRLPLVVQVDGLLAVHASLHCPGEFPYIFGLEDARRNFVSQDTRLSFHGHSHVPIIWEEHGAEIKVHVPRTSHVRLARDRRYCINVGSVGQPRDGDPRACYVIYDQKTAELTFRRIPYDIEAARLKILAHSISPKNAERLRKGE